MRSVGYFIVQTFTLLFSYKYNTHHAHTDKCVLSGVYLPACIICHRIHTEQWGKIKLCGEISPGSTRLLCCHCFISAVFLNVKLFMAAEKLRKCHFLIQSNDAHMHCLFKKVDVSEVEQIQRYTGYRF